MRSKVAPLVTFLIQLPHVLSRLVSREVAAFHSGGDTILHVGNQQNSQVVGNPLEKEVPRLAVIHQVVTLDSLGDDRLRAVDVMQLREAASFE
jgi:hypothetical protein